MPNQIAFYPQSSGGTGLPTASAAGQVPTSTGAGTTYTAQAPVWSLIQEQTVSGSAAATVTFSGIPQTFSNLKLLVNARGGSTAGPNIALQFNTDTGAHYTYSLQLSSTGAGFFSTQAASATLGLIGNLTLSTATAGQAGSADVTIYSYAGTTFAKNYSSYAVSVPTASTSELLLVVGSWLSTAAITSITILEQAGNTFAVGSTFSLYGIQ